MKTQTAWATTRYSVDGHSYIDILTIDSLPELSHGKAQEADRKCGPQWARDNAIGQVVEITIRRK